MKHLSDIDFKNFMNVFRKCIARLCSFLINDTTLTSDSPLRFRRNRLER